MAFCIAGAVVLVLGLVGLAVVFMDAALDPDCRFEGVGEGGDLT